MQRLVMKNKILIAQVTYSLSKEIIPWLRGGVIRIKNTLTTPKNRANQRQARKKLSGVKNRIINIISGRIDPKLKGSPQLKAG